MSSLVMACSLRFRDYGVDIDGAGTAAVGFVGAGIETNVQGVEGAKHEAQFCARMAALDLDDPLTADADRLAKAA